MNHKPEVVFILLMLAAASSEVAAAQTWIPGVAAGDYFNYTMYGVYVTNQSNLNIPPFEYNNTDWTRINVTGVEGSVTYQVYTLRYKNGSENSFSFKCNVDPANKSSLKFNEKGVPLCAANLTVGDTVPTDETIIDETVNRTYASGNRETNHAFWNSSTDWGDIYFDRETGMLVELHRTHRFGDGAEAVDKTDVILLTGTNRWQVSPETQQVYTPFHVALAIGVLAMLILIITVYRVLVHSYSTANPASKEQITNK